MSHSVLRFNGERPDPVTGTIHSGNGYRGYDPAVMRFNCPDSMSPFDAGGINTYLYCCGDPVNRADPSGHFSLGQWCALGLGLIAGIALGVMTDGAAIPVVLTLMASIARGAAVGAVCELAAEGIDGQSVDWRNVGLAAGEGGLAELCCFGVGRGFSKTYGAVKRSFSRATTPLVDNVSVIPLGGTQSLHGISTDFGYFAFTDTYADKPRFTILGHGSREDTENIAFGSHNISAATLAGHLKDDIPQNTQYVRLAMCYSANNGPSSFAQQLANELKLPVKAFHGRVSVKYPFFSSMLKLKKPVTSRSDLLALKDKIADLSGMPFLEKITANYAPEWFHPQNSERPWHNPTDLMHQDLLNKL